MSEYRTRASGFCIVAAVILVGPALLPPAFSQDASFRTSGQAAGVSALRHIQARITGIDTLHNSVTLRDTRGEMAVIEISPDVTEFHLRDTVKSHMETQFRRIWPGPHRVASASDSKPNLCSQHRMAKPIRPEAWSCWRRC